MTSPLIDRPGELLDLVGRFLNDRYAMALATQGPDGPWVASVYFAGGLDGLYFLSSPQSCHGRNLGRDPRVSAATNEDEHDWRALRGCNSTARVSSRAHQACGCVGGART
jgi:uncharacterized protein YhbP (UPF0306 family)